MPFSWPNTGEITYRLWRLKRLIAVCAILPLVFFAIMALIGFGSMGTATVGLLPIALFSILVVAGHAVLFPNSNQETVALSMTLTVLAIVAPIISGSIFGWFLFLIFAFWMQWAGQFRILNWQTATSTRSVTFAGKVKTSAPLEKARQWFPLRPDSVRGQFKCGPADETGMFPVWFDSGDADWLDAVGINDLSGADAPGYGKGDMDLPDEEREELRNLLGDDAFVDFNSASFYARIETDEPNLQRTQILIQGEGKEPDIHSVVEHTFKTGRNGCTVREVEQTAQFPWAQSMFMWLADFQADGLVHLRDLLEERQSLSLRATHKLGLLPLFSGWIMKRFLLRGMDQEALADEYARAQDPGEPVEVSDKLKALLQRLGPDYEKHGYTKGPLPLVTLEEFFDGNDDDGSFQGAPVSVAATALQSLRNRPDVADIRLGITQWEGPSTWPLAEYLYFVTTAQANDVKTWLKSSNIWVSELDTDGEHHTREDLQVPEGHRVVWAWVD